MSVLPFSLDNNSPFSLDSPSTRGERLEVFLALWYCTCDEHCDDIVFDDTDAHLNIVEVGIELIVLTHEVIEGPHLQKIVITQNYA